MGMFSPRPKLLPATVSSYSQNSINGKLSAYESCFMPFGRISGRRRDQLQRTGIFILIFVLILGFVDHFSRKIGELDITKGFHYPLNIPNFQETVEEFRFKLPNLAFVPITNYSRVEYLHKAVNTEGETSMPHGLLIVIKSAIKNVEKRQAIRQTWGQFQYLEDTKLSPHLPTKLVFICGVPAERDFNEVEELFPHEWKHNDIVVADYVDSYANNTYKSILALKWGVEYPADFQYLFLVDDDMYVDLVNLVTYLRNFPNRTFEKSIQMDGSQVPFYQLSTIYNKNRSLITGHSILHHGLYMGQVYWNAAPIRKSWIFRAKKHEWVVPMVDYPYNYYASYIPGAAIVFSKETVHKIYYASLFVKHFKIDDVYLGIVANKVGIIPVQNQHFYAWYPESFHVMAVQDFAESIAIHGCECTDDMVDLWTNRNLSGRVKCQSQ